MGGGGGGNSGPTLQQQQLETAQAKMNADLNLQENEQRKVILNSLNGMRVFRGSALSRAVAGNTPGGAYGGPSPTQIRGGRGGVINPAAASILDTAGSGSTPAGGAGSSGGGGTAVGGRAGASIGRAGARGANIP